MINLDRSKAKLKVLRESLTNDDVWKDAERTPKRMRDVPYEIRDSPLQDLVKAVKALRAKEKTFKRKFKFRRKKDDAVSIAIRARQLNCETSRGSVWPKLFGTTRDRSAMRTEKNKSLPGVFSHDTRLICERKTGFWYLCVPVTIPSVESETQGLPLMTSDEHKRGRLVSIDPGVRTFATCYDPDGGVFEWGVAPGETLRYLLMRATRLEKKALAAKGTHRRRIGAVASRIRKRHTDLVNELHRKFARWLCTNYEAILLPKFDTKSMVRHSRRRKIGKKTAGTMVRLAHFKFRQFLQHKADEMGTILVLCDERYTSKTCGVCGRLHQTLGASKNFKCPSCGYEVDRDHNAARNIILAFAGQSPALFGA